MDKKGKQRLAIVTVILLAAIGFLAFRSNMDAAYMRTIKEVQDDPQYVGSTVRVAGLVVPNSIKEVGGSTYRFKIQDKGRVMAIEYSGAKPSNFKDNIQVIALGKLSTKSDMKASEIVTKCPSKYESKADKPK